VVGQEARPGPIKSNHTTERIRVLIMDKGNGFHLILVEILRLLSTGTTLIDQ
jgi:hypothetical protein